jgi:Ca2+/H+ antiporter
MQSITFAVPTLATASMTKADQMDIVLNQATVVIVCSYLEHMNKVLDKGLTTSPTGAAFLILSELVSLID